MKSILQGNTKGCWEKVEGFGVRVHCPGCGSGYFLDHDVKSDGTVTPSLDCPSCEFHEFVRLEGYKD
jgi:hypothetical protein